MLLIVAIQHVLLIVTIQVEPWQCSTREPLGTREQTPLLCDTPCHSRPAIPIDKCDRHGRLTLTQYRVYSGWVGARAHAMISVTKLTIL